MVMRNLWSGALLGTPNPHHRGEFMGQDVGPSLNQVQPRRGTSKSPTGLSTVVKAQQSFVVDSPAVNNEQLCLRHSISGSDDITAHSI